MTKPIVHRLWLGPKEMPNEYQEFGKMWQILNPDWKVADWDFAETLRYDWQNWDVLDSIKRRGTKDGKISVECAVQLADVLGYELIYRFGGVYVNVDIEPIRPLSHMFDHYALQYNDAYAALEDGGRVVNAVLGASVPEHPFWKCVIEKLPAYYWADPTAEMVSTTGPVLLTDCVRDWNQNELGDKFVILPQESFNPVHWSQIPAGGDAEVGKKIFGHKEGVIGVHHWAHRKTGRSNTVSQENFDFDHNQ